RSGPVGLDLAHQRVGQRHVAQRTRLVVAVGIDPAEEFARVLRAFRILRLLARQDEVGGGDRPGVLAGRIGHHQVEVAGRGPVGARGGGGEGLFAGVHEVAGGVLQARVGELVLQRVGQLDITDAALDLLDVGGDALVALAADTDRPLHRGAFAHAVLPALVDLGQVVGEVEARARTVGAVDDGDLVARQRQAAAERDDGRIAQPGYLYLDDACQRPSILSTTA